MRLTCPPASTRYSRDTVLIRGEPNSRPRPGSKYSKIYIHPKIFVKNACTDSWNLENFTLDILTRPLSMTSMRFAWLSRQTARLRFCTNTETAMLSLIIERVCIGGCHVEKAPSVQFWQSCDIYGSRRWLGRYPWKVCWSHYSPPPCRDQAHTSLKSNLFKCPVPHSHLADFKKLEATSQSIVWCQCKNKSLTYLLWEQTCKTVFHLWDYPSYIRHTPR